MPESLPNPTPDSPEPVMPAGLLAELRSHYGQTAAVSPAVDNAVRAAAREAFASPASEVARAQRMRLVYRIAGSLAAAAAIGVVVILSGVFNGGPDRGAPPNNAAAPSHALAGDVNADGRINIVDAYVLQRRIELSQALQPAWDLNADGKVDAEDVGAIASQSVKLQRVDQSRRATHAGRFPMSDDFTFVHAEPAVRFTTFDIVIDANAQPLAVYQVDIRATQGDVRFTGIEGGEHEAFRSPPYHDPEATRTQQDRIIIAAFNTAGADKLPRGKVRVATIHLQITGDVEPKFEARLDAAATVDGKPVEATVTVQRKGTQL